MANLVKVIIDNKEIEVDENLSIIQAAEQVGIHIPRLCYHKRLSLVGKCRVCLVEIVGKDKPVSSCTCKVSEGMEVKTKSALAIQSRKDVLELLLSNHPLDCPNCKKSNECSLQDVVIETEIKESIFPYKKLKRDTVQWTKNIQYIPDRCIKCLRCVRFCEEIAGRPELGEFNRGNQKIISPIENKEIESNLFGNIIDICPVGALIDTQFAKKGIKNWELESYETIDTQDSILPNIYADVNNNKIVRIRGRENDEINQEWISNKTRFLFPDLYSQRIENPKIEGQNAEWPQVLDYLMHKIQNSKSEKIAGLLGDKLSLEDIYSFILFMTNTIGSENIALISKNKEINDVIFETSIKNIEDIDVFISVGTNFERKSPVLSSRIFQSSKKDDFKFYHMGNNLNKYPYKINNLGKELDQILKESNSLMTDLEKNKNIQAFLDMEALDGLENGKAIYHVFKDIKEKYDIKLNKYVKNSGYINSAKIKTDMGLFVDYEKTINNLKNEKIDILFVYGNQNIDLNLIKKAEFIVYIGTYSNDISRLADVVLPSVTSTEKNSLWTNVEGKVLESKAVTLPYADSKVDWKIWRALSEYLNKPLDFNSLEDLRKNLLIG